MIQEIILGISISYLILFFLSIILKDNSIVDIFWGLGFLQVTIHSIYLSGQLILTQIILFTIILFWSFRLSGYVFYKRLKRKSEDSRYLKWRKEWKFFHIRSFFQIYILQGLLLLIISTPIILFNLNSRDINIYFIIGLIVALLGLLFETIADIQLSKFIHYKKNKNKIMQNGLWKYSRHPNYFGESIFWLGITIIGLISSEYSIISYITITILLRYVSGVPMAERNYKDNKEFQKYCKNTPPFTPKLPF